ncbi:PpiC domain-containing protein [Rariglobus hedericola]
MLPFRSDIAANNPESFRGSASTFNSTDALLPARNLIQRGGFNINSTSVAAWRAVLGSLGGTNFNGESSLTGPFVRSIRQSGGSANAGTGISPNSWSGFRNLTTAQIDALAIQLVAQIKQRGPAVSLADFINRKLVADTAANAPDGLAGPIQAAIDASGVNSALTNQIKNWDNIDANIATATAAPLYPYPAHLPVHPLEGIAGWLSQADIVQAIAPVLTARSDTFRIRTYGETRNPVTDELTGRAWCEAIVQRLPDYIVPSENDAIATGTALTTNNRQFGRKFIVTGFRWLTADEI